MTQSSPPSGATHRAECRSEANTSGSTAANTAVNTSGNIAANAAATIVPMTVAHIDALLPFEREMFGTEAWTRAGYRSELADTRHRYYVAAVGPDGELLGWAGVRVLADTAEILTVGVVPNARRAGTARCMVRELLAEALRRGASEAFLEVRVDNAAARALYADEGFTDVGLRRGYYDAGRVDAVTMRKDLRAELPPAHPKDHAE